MSGQPDIPTIPALRFGVPYDSLDVEEVRSHRDGTPLAKVGQVNAGIIRRDLKRAPEKGRLLRELSTPRLLEICLEAGGHFRESTLPLNESGDVQSPQDYVETLSATSGLPHALCRRNMEKVCTVFEQMPTILKGLTRGLDLGVVDAGEGTQDGVPVSYAPVTATLGVVLPSNSPGVNSIWMPSIALKTPVILKPGREEPWTPLRIIQAFLAAGCPREAFGFYPTTHEGAATILEVCGRSLIFGDDRTTAPYAADPRVQIHGAGRSKVILGADEVARWSEHLDVLDASIADNGGRSCINASSIFVPSHGDAIAEALARRLAPLEPGAPDDPAARLSAFANPKFAEFIDQAIEAGLRQGGEDVTARFRDGPRLVTRDGGTYLRPTVIRCPGIDHPLANTEFLFPFTSVVEVPEESLLDVIGPTLVVTAITRDTALAGRLLASPLIQRLNLGPLPTSRVEWDQPHEGNLFEFLYTRRAIQRAPQW